MAIAPGASGRDVGEGLRHLLDVVLDDPSANSPGRLEAAIRDWWKARREGSGSTSTGL